MKLLQRFFFVLFSVITIFIVVSGQASAANTTIEIQGAYVLVFPEAEATGLLYNAFEQPQLTFVLLESGGIYEDEVFIVPTISTAWEPTSGNSQRWTAQLDLSDVPNGNYDVLVTTILSNGSTTFDILVNDGTNNCEATVCLPGGVVPEP